ncbi:MAG: hypothetical protein ACREID_01285, partial [Planctomycetota bacterium]
VAASDIAAHREVCGDVPFYAPPGDAAALRRALRAALSCGEERLQRGVERAKAYTWGAAAARLGALIRRRACSPGR